MRRRGSVRGIARAVVMAGWGPTCVCADANEARVGPRTLVTDAEWNRLSVSWNSLGPETGKVWQDGAILNSSMNGSR